MKPLQAFIRTDAEGPGTSRPKRWSAAAHLKRQLLLWSLFFLICLGLGYPSVKRYNPGAVEGLSDAIIYQQMIKGEPSGRARADIFRCRVLVPGLAALFYRLTRRVSSSWEPALFALLIAESLFCATTALLLYEIAWMLFRQPGLSLSAALLYLLNFDIANLQLAGIIDAGESCLILAVVWSLLGERWWLLPLWAIIGPLAKETFVPFASVLMLLWWLSCRRERALRDGRLGYVAAATALCVITLILTRVLVLGHVVWPWNIAAQMDSHTNYLASLWRCVTDRGFWYVFGWLLPLGVWRLRELPGAWVKASAGMAATALLFGAYNDMQGTVARPIFNTVGPLLTLSATILLTSSLLPGSGRRQLSRQNDE